MTLAQLLFLTVLFGIVFGMVIAYIIGVISVWYHNRR